MKRILKIIGIIVLVFLVLYILTSFISKHGWKIWGFAKCESPSEIYISDVYVTDESVNLVGRTISSALKYNGYTYKILGESLYVGVRYGLFEGDGANFSLKIEGEFSQLKNLIMTNQKEEQCVWNLEKDKKYMEKIQKVRLYETVSVSNENDYKTEMKNVEFVYADEELLKRIQHPTFSDGLYLSKGGGYLGVAELQNGEELYLSFERHYDYYNIIGKSAHYDY